MYVSINVSINGILIHLFIMKHDEKILKIPTWIQAMSLVVFETSVDVSTPENANLPIYFMG